VDVRGCDFIVINT